MELINSRLCRFCQTLVGTEKYGGTHSHYPKVWELIASAESCPLCTTILSLLQQRTSHLHHHHKQTKSFSYEINYTEQPPALLVERVYTFHYRYGDTSDHHFGSNIILRPSDRVQNDSTPVTGQSDDTNSHQALSTAFNWFTNCVATHDKCKLAVPVNLRPSRVLDLGTPGSPVLRLCIWTDSSPVSRYMTLSHCWGKVQIKQLTTSNLSSLCESIEISELPKTFQDAVFITRKCEVQYLWIDSLCIIQNSPTDWATEAANMGNIYRGATCNIAATKAADGRAGCFSKRNPDFAIPLRVQPQYPRFKVQRAQRGHVVRSKKGPYYLVPENLWSGHIENAPLNGRGWVFQERILSPRILHCADNQLYWECQQMKACEAYPRGWPLSSVSTAAADFIINLKYELLATKSNESSSNKVPTDDDSDGSSTSTDYSRVKERSMVQRWNELISIYTSYSLTKETDRLVAISAVAKEMQPLVDAEYFAGMWRTDMEASLLWDVSGDSFARSDDYVAPSWSWASVRGKIYSFDPTPSEDLLEMTYMICDLSPAVTLAASDPFGQVTSGSLHLRGWTRSLSDMTIREIDGRRCLSFEERRQGSFSFDTNSEYSTRDIYCLPVLEYESPFYGFQYRDNYQYSPNDKKNNAISTMGLLLISSNTGTKRQFLRVGTFFSDWPKDGRRLTRPPYVLCEGRYSIQAFDHDPISSVRNHGLNGRVNAINDRESYRTKGVRGWVGKTLRLLKDPEELADDETRWTEGVVEII